MTTGDAGSGTTRQRGLVLLLIGYLAVVVSLALAYQGPDNEFTGPPTCDGEVMSPGDRCVTFWIGRTGADSSSQTYEEALASQRDWVKEKPWMWGMVLGTVGTILVFTGAGRGLTGRERPGGEVFTRLAATATVPLLVVSGVVGWLELRYDRDLRERSLFLTLPGNVPGAPLLMVALVGLATAVAYAGVRSSYRTAQRIAQWQAENEARLREGIRFAPPAGSPFQEFFQQGPPTGAGQPAGGATATAGTQFQDYVQGFFQQPAGAGLGQPAGAAAATAGAGGAAGTPDTAQPRAQPPSGPYDTWIGLLRIGQLLGALASALWIGSISQWHWGCVLLVLVGGVVVTMMGTEHTPGVQLAFQFVLAAVQVAAIAVTAWIGGLSDWHAGIVTGFWTGVAAVTYAASDVVRFRSGPADKRPQRQLHLPLALLVPLLLLVIGAVTTVRLGELSGWQWDTVLAVWLGVSVAAATYAAVTGMVAYPAGRPADRVHLSGLVPIGLVLAAAVASGWLVDASGGHPGLLLLAVWGGVCAVVVIQVLAGPRRARLRRATATVRGIDPQPAPDTRS